MPRLRANNFPHSKVITLTRLHCLALKLENTHIKNLVWDWSDLNTRPLRPKRRIIPS